MRLGASGAKSRFAEFALAIVCLIWGSTFVLVKKALDDVSPALFLAFRFSIAAVLLAVVFAIRRKSDSVVVWSGGILTGLFLFAGYLLQTIGLKFTTPAKSGFLTGLYIVLVPLLTALVYRRVPGISEWVGVLLATAGMGLMTLTSARLEMGLGDLLTVACAGAFAVHILLLGHYAKRMPTEWLTLLQIGACAIFAAISCRFVETPFVRWTPRVWVALSVTACLATALAFLLQTWGQRYTTPTRAALIFSLEPVFAWLTSYVFEHEVLTRQVLAGAGCILAGILLVELKPLQRGTQAFETSGN
ncbi:MAG TPA: DMT family transporter [Bryobacteraceae bacterium]|nr:DMT family transporter [Bryobacteraceae bacterium]